jgi:hypothetical protein
MQRNERLADLFLLQSLRIVLQLHDRSSGGLPLQLYCQEDLRVLWLGRALRRVRQGRKEAIQQRKEGGRIEGRAFSWIAEGAEAVNGF